MNKPMTPPAATPTAAMPTAAMPTAATPTAATPTAAAPVPTLRHIVHNSLWLFAERALRFGLGFAFTVTLGRTLSLQQVGYFQAALSLVLLFAPLASLGLNSLLSREILRVADQPGRIDTILRAATRLRLLGALLALMLMLASAQLLSMQLLPWVIILGVAQAFSALGAFDFFFESRIEGSIIARWRALSYALFALLKIGLLLAGYALTVLVVVTALEWIAASLPAVILYRCHHRVRDRAGSAVATGLRHYQARLLAQSKWLLLSGLAVALYYRLDQVMLLWLDTPASTGEYGLAVRLSELSYMVPALLMSSFYPRLLALKQADSVRYEQTLRLLFGITAWMALLLIVLTLGFGRALVFALWGESHQAIVTLLQIHIFGAFFVFTRAVFSKWLLVEDLLPYSLYTQGSGALLNLGLNWYLIPRYGAVGAALATVAAHATAGFVAVLAWPKTRPAAWMMLSSTLLLPRYLLRAGRRFWARRGI